MELLLCMYIIWFYLYIRTSLISKVTTIKVKKLQKIIWASFKFSPMSINDSTINEKKKKKVSTRSTYCD